MELCLSRVCIYVYSGFYIAVATSFTDHFRYIVYDSSLSEFSFQGERIEVKVTVAIVGKLCHHSSAFIIPSHNGVMGEGCIGSVPYLCTSSL